MAGGTALRRNAVTEDWFPILIPVAYLFARQKWKIRSPLCNNPRLRFSLLDRRLEDRQVAGGVVHRADERDNCSLSPGQTAEIASIESTAEEFKDQPAATAADDSAKFFNIA